MKRMLTFLSMLVLVPITLMRADGTGDNPSSDPIKLEIVHGDSNPTPLRAPIHINLSASYDEMTGIIIVSYIGEAEGSVELYLDGALFAVSSEINSVFQTSESGCYHLVIQTDGWVAQGYVQV